MAKRIVPQDFYVYAHHKETTGEIFYIGKGCGNRAWSHRGRSKWWESIAKKHGVDVRIVQDGLQEWAAFEIERDLIALHGREVLCNLTDGGEGCANPSEEVRNASSKRLKSLMDRQLKNPAYIENLRQKSSIAMSCPEKRSMHSEIMKKLRANKEFNELRKIAYEKARCVKVICVTNGIVFQSSAEAAEYAGVSRQSITDALKGRSKTSGGHIWLYA